MSFAPISAEVALLRSVLTPDLKLNVGRELMVRVADTPPGGRGTINLAGVMLDAQLPSELKAGDELRLVVASISPERVVLQVVQDPLNPAAQQAAQAAAAQVPLPDGSYVAVSERPRGGPAPGGDQTHTLALRYDAPALGALDMRFVMDGTGLRLALTVPAGASYDATTSAASELAGALAGAAGRGASVSVAIRREPLEVFA